MRVKGLQLVSTLKNKLLEIRSNNLFDIIYGRRATQKAKKMRQFLHALKTPTMDEKRQIKKKPIRFLPSVEEGDGIQHDSSQSKWSRASK